MNFAMMRSAIRTTTHKNEHLIEVMSSFLAKDILLSKKQQRNSGVAHWQYRSLMVRDSFLQTRENQKSHSDRFRALGRFHGAHEALQNHMCS